MIVGDVETTTTLIAKIGGCWSPSFSPDGKRIAFISDLNGVPQIWTVPREGGWPTLVTALEDQIRVVNWSPDGDWLAFGLAPGGGMNEQIYLVRPDGTGLRRLSAGGKETNWLGPWAYDSRALTIISNRDDPQGMNVYLVDIESGEFTLIARNQGTGTLTDISRDGQRATLHRVANRSDSNHYLLDLANKKEFSLTDHEWPGNFDNAKFSPDGQTIYLTSDKDQDRVGLSRISIDEHGQPGLMEVLARRDDAEVQQSLLGGLYGWSGFTISEDGQIAALVWNVAGRNELVFLDLETLEITPGPELPAEIIERPSFSKDGCYLVFVASGSTLPKNIWVFDRETGHTWSVTDTPHPGVKLSDLVSPEMVTFQAHDGLELSGWLYRPHGSDEPGPLVLDFHGGPEAQARPVFDFYFQALLSQGIAVLAANVRGSGGFGKTFVNLDNGPLRFNGIRDIKACYDFVVGEGIAEPGRVGIAGGSYGGYMTMCGLTEYPDLFAAGANLYGVVNFKTFFEQTEPWMAAISKIQYGDPDTQSELLHSLSPIHKIDQVIAPTLVLHGANDTNVPVIEAEQVVDNLRERNIPVDYILFPDEGHGFRKESNRITATVAVVKWFVKYLRHE
jgi:dipeptidyl aminopeptidase/acylaminoacyl peptidase